MADDVDTIQLDDIDLAEQALLGQAGADGAAALERLRQADPARYWQSHERVLAQLAARLRAGETVCEPNFFAAFTRLADHLLLDNPATFARRVADARNLPLLLPAHRQLTQFYAGLALGLDDRYAEALLIFDGLLADADLDEQVRGRTLNTRANYCRYTGRLEEALAGYGASLALWRRLGNRLREGLALLNLGITHYDLRDYGAAGSNLTLAVRCFEEAGADAPAWIAAAQNELGLVYRDQGRWADALASLRSAAAYYQAQQAHEPLSRVRNNIGEVLLFQGQMDAAAAAFQQALAEMHTRTYAVDVHLNLGLARQISGDMPGALAAFQAALDLALSIGRQDMLAQVHYRLGEALRRTGCDDEALAQFVAGAEVIEKTREPLRDEGLKISLMGRWQQVYEALVLHCLAMRRTAEAFAWAERARARAFADALAGPSPVAPAVVATVDELCAVLPAGAALLCYFTTGVLEQDQPLLGRLPPKSALREHLVTPPRTLLFCVTGAGVVAHDCPLDPNAFASTSPRQDDAGRYLAPPVLRRLFDWLLAPAGDALAAQRLTIIAHGPLHRIPFGALISPDGEPMTHSGGPVLAYAPSATVLLHLLQMSVQTPRDLPAQAPADLPEPVAGQFLAIGYDGQVGPLALRHTEAEARFVAHVTAGWSWTGPEPKGARLLAASRTCDQLHFACHGRFDYEQPLESYLQISQTERLTARAVIESWQLPAALVVLSACQTGVSRLLRGDEAMGLVRAFLYAGARAVVVSQWPVEDFSTFLLMRRLYQALPALGPAHALQAAQVWLRELTAEQARQLAGELQAQGLPVAAVGTVGDAGASVPYRPFADARYWAAFMLVGAG